jgi:hypothetical protein
LDTYAIPEGRPIVKGKVFFEIEILSHMRTARSFLPSIFTVFLFRTEIVLTVLISLAEIVLPVLIFRT